MEPIHRYLTLLEVADLLHIDESIAAKNRARRVQRMFEALERRDGKQYLHRSEAGSTGNRIKVCVEDLSALDPWMPSTTQALRNDLDKLSERLKRFSGQVRDESKDTDERLTKVENYLVEMSKYLEKSSHQSPPTPHGAPN